MSGTKKHIDKLFADIFKDFSLLVSNKDMEAIDDKTSVFKEQEGEQEPKGLFGAFEINIDDADWLATKAKLDNEKSMMAQDHMLSGGLKDLELPVLPEDWTRTYEKLQAAKKRRMAYWWWLSAGIIILALGGWWMGNNKSDDTLLSTKAEASQETNSSHGGQSDIHDKSDGNTNTGIEKETSSSAQTESVQGKNKASENEPTAPLAQQGNTGKKSLVSKGSGNISAIDQTVKKHHEEKTVITNGKALKKTVVQSAEPLNKDLEEPFSEEDLVNTTVGTETELVNKVDQYENKVNEEKTAEEVKTAVSEKQPEPNPNDTSIKKKVQDDPPVPMPPKNRVYIGLVTQLASTFRHLDRENKGRYNAIRNTAEKPFAQWTIGLELGVIKKRMQASAGAQVTSQSWASHYQYSYKVYDSIPVRDTSGKIIGHFLTRGRDTSINEEQVVKISKIMLPFEFSRSFKINNKLNLLGTLGGSVGVVTRTEGNKILNPVNNYLYTYRSLKDQERKLSFVPSLAIGAQYMLNKQFMLQGSLYGNYSATGRFKNSFQANDHPYSIGISIKLMYMIK